MAENGADTGNGEHESTALVALGKPGPGVSSFSSLDHFEAAQRMGRLLAASSLVPTAYQGPEGVANCVLAMELASRINASVFMVMQNLNVINGKPGWSSTFLIATVNTCGRFTPLGYRFLGKKGTDSWGCEAHAMAIHTGDELVGEAVTVQMAKDEGWYGKKGSKWPNLTGQMLRYRAAAFWTRVYAPELALGMQTSEEIYDVDVDPEAETKAKTIARVEELRQIMEGANPPPGEEPGLYFEVGPDEDPEEELRKIILDPGQAVKDEEIARDIHEASISLEEEAAELPDDMPA